MINHHNIYIIKTEGKDNSLVKLGYSSDINTRLNTYFAYNPLTKLVYTCYLEEGKLLEKLVHSLETPIYNKEWYSAVNLEKLLSYIKHSTDYMLYDNTIKLDQIQHTSTTKELNIVYKKNLESIIEKELKSIEDTLNKFEWNIPAYIHNIQIYLEDILHLQTNIKNHMTYGDYSKTDKYLSRLDYTMIYCLEIIDRLKHPDKYTEIII